MTGQPCRAPDDEGAEVWGRCLLEQLPLPAFACDAQGRITYCNEYAARLSAGRFAGDDPPTCFGGALRLYTLEGELIEPDRGPTARAVRSGQEERQEVLIERPEGTRVAVLLCAAPIRDASGTLVGASTVLLESRPPSSDERKRAEQALRDSEERYRSVVEGSLQGILIHQDGHICYANEALARMFQYDSAHDLIGQPLWKSFVRPENIAELQERTRAILAGAPIPPHPGWCAVGKAGRSIWVTTTASRIQFRGRPAVVAFYLDISERKRAEEERRALEAKIQHAQKLESLGVLAGGIAHDFNNLLTAILGNASLARLLVADTAPAGAMLQDIEKAAERAADLTQQMLAYAGKGRFVVEPVRLDLLVHEMANLLRTVVSKKATVDLNLEPATIEGDATQVRQLVLNLLTNASDALEDQAGTIRIRTGARHAAPLDLRSAFVPTELPAGRYAFVEVEDTGCGMNDETLPRIFDPFFTTKFTGRGLGLAAALGIVRSHRGTVKVASTPGKGALFQVFFPCAADLAPARAETRDRPLQFPGQGTVLVVEDEPSVRAIARLVLERGGFHVHTAADGQAGVEMFAQYRQEINVIVLDLTMPRMDGLEVLRRVRRLDPSVPILLMSGYTETDVSSRSGGNAANGFIHKPFQPDDLLERVCRLALPATRAKNS